MAREAGSMSEAPAGAIAAAIAAVDLEGAMQQAVYGVLHKRLDAVAAKAVDAVLDEATLAELREAAEEAARTALQAPGDEAPELYYPNALAWVTEWLAPTYRRSLDGSGVTWCPKWWSHAEGRARLEALWRAWEHLRLDPATGMSVWFRDHADHHMNVLLNEDGPFKGCNPADGHNARRLKPLPLSAPDAGLF
jgi:hypothetical protein